MTNRFASAMEELHAAQSGTVVFNVADLVDPADPAGRSYRDVNRAKTHNIPLGSLVELETGARLFVVRHDRDCDQTPLYSLAADADGHAAEGSLLSHLKWVNGYSEGSLTVIRVGGA